MTVAVMDYFISDIHGEYQLLKQLLLGVNFGKGDRLFVLGDMIDKGENGVAVMQFLKDLPNAYCIIGNHEHNLLKYYHSITQHQDVDFDIVLVKLRAYLGGDGYLLDWDTMDWLLSLPYYWDTEYFLCVHAGIPVDCQGNILPPQKATPSQLVYDRDFKDNSLISPSCKCVLFGHTPTRYVNGSDKIIVYKTNDLPTSIANLQKVHLDTGVYLSGVLGCFCLPTCQCYYVKKK